MDKSELPLVKLVEQYLITCRTEGKTPLTQRGYRESWAALSVGQLKTVWPISQ